VSADGRLTSDEIAAYRRDGYVIVRGLLGTRSVEACRQALSDLAADRVPKTETRIWLESGFRIEDIPAERREAYVRKYMDYVDDAPALKAAAMSRRLHRILDQLLGEGRVLFQEMALVKPPEIGSDKPWHQDASYFRVTDPALIAGVWIALDQATRENGCMEVVPGSHHGGPAPHVHENDLSRCAIPEATVRRDAARALEMAPGDALIFHALLHHFTGPNRTNRHRRAIQFHYHQSGAAWGSLADHQRLYHHADGSYAGCTTLHGDAANAAYVYRGPLPRPVVPIDDP
jgi:phytanoyl-CoA hydroxylase